MRALQGIAWTKPAFFSSGDLLADRRYHYAMALAARGERAAAIDLLLQALALAPQFAGAWFALGELRAEAGEHAGAIAAFEASRAADPDDRAGAALQLARLGAVEACAGMPLGYVRSLFDQYAAEFDHRLVERLAYRGPALLRAAIGRTCAREHRIVRFSSALDLGCGTGLAGAALRDVVDHLTGVDLSPAMIEQARAKNVYDRLEVGDLLSFLAARPAGVACYDLISAADVLPYCPDLAPIARAAARALGAGGLFAFTAETHPGEGVVLGGALRYAHGAAHIRVALEQAGLVALEFTSIAARTEAGAPVPGLAVTAVRPGAACQPP